MKKRIIKRVILLFILISTPLLIASISYNYSYYGKVIHSSPGYNYLTHVNPSVLGVEYSEPRDLVVFNDNVYVIALNRNINKDVLIKLNKDLEVVDVISEYELTDDYENKVISNIDNAFAQVEKIYNDLFEEKIIYPGTKLPILESDKLIESAEFNWDIGDETIVKPTGETQNDSEGILNTDLLLTVKLRGKEQVMNFTVNVNSNINGINSIGTLLNPSYEFNELVEVETINEVLGYEIDNIEYNVVKDIIDFHKDEATTKDDTIFEFEFGNFEIKYEYDTNEESEFEYKEIIFTELESSVGNIDTLHDSMFEEIYETRGARGIAVVEDNIYLADSEKGRIIKLTHDYKVVDAFFGVDDETFKAIDYKPYKITVDISGRMYVVASGVYEGVLELDSDGSFNRYVGVNPIKLTPVEVLRRFLMSEAQKARTSRFLPTSYTNVAINHKSFIFATALPRENEAEDIIQLINPKGIDVLKRNGYHPPMGDIMFVNERNNYVIDGPSELVDIAIGKGGIYSVLDAKRSRIFTYDDEGNLLYVNGDKGDQSDKFARGVALDYLNDNILVLDRDGTIILYSPTEFGEKVNEAVYLHSIGEFGLARNLWEEVIKLNTNYEVAYKGIGRFHLREKNYKEAMKNFKLGHDQYYYSKAFVNYRNEVIKKNFGFIFIGIILLISSPFVISYLIKRRK